MTPQHAYATSQRACAILAENGITATPLPANMASTSTHPNIDSLHVCCGCYIDGPDGRLYAVHGWYDKTTGDDKHDPETIATELADGIIQHVNRQNKETAT